jgi:hypothetical protein
MPATALRFVDFCRCPVRRRIRASLIYADMRSLGQAGIVSVASRELVQVTSAEHWSWIGTLLKWRDDLRCRAARGCWRTFRTRRTHSATGCW